MGHNLENNMQMKWFEFENQMKDLNSQTRELIKTKEDLKLCQEKLKVKEDDYEKLLHSKNREHKEEAKFFDLLDADLKSALEEKDVLAHTNEKLRNVISEAVMSTMTMEEEINKKLKSAMLNDKQKDLYNFDTEDDSDPGCSMLSFDGYEISQRLSDSLFLGPDIESDIELFKEINAKSFTAVNNLLEIVVDTTKQLHTCQHTHNGLIETINTEKQENKA